MAGNNLTDERRLMGGDAPPSRPQEAPLLTYGVGALLLLAAALLSHAKVADDDCFWHLATGRWIARHGSIPDRDVFGLITGGQQWYPFEWGWSLFTYWLYTSAGSFVPVQIFMVLAWAAITAFMIATLRSLRVSAPLTLAITALALLISTDRMTPRPQVISILGLSILLFVLVSRGRYPSGRLYALPVLFLVWGNMHAGVISGMIVLCLFVGNELYLSVVAARGGNTGRQGRTPRTLLPAGVMTPGIRRLLGVTGLCAGAMLVNPHGAGLYIYLAEHVRMKFLSAIVEWTPSLEVTGSQGIAWLYKILLLLGTATLWYSFRTRNPLYGLLYLAAAAYSLRAFHFIADFAVIAAPVTGAALQEVISSIPARPAFRNAFRHPATSIFLALPLLYCLWRVPDNSFYAALGSRAHFGFGVDSAYFPLRAIDFLKRETISGRPFNQFNIGGILLWEVPGEPDFIDSRDINDWIAGQYLMILGMQPGFEKKVEVYGIDHFIFHLPDLHGDAGEMTSTPIPYLSTHRLDWKLVYWDDRSFIYLRNTERFGRTIDAFAYRVLDPYLFAFRPQEFDSLRRAHPDLFAAELRRKLSEEPRGTVVRYIAREAASAGGRTTGD